MGKKRKETGNQHDAFSKDVNVKRKKGPKRIPLPEDDEVSDDVALSEEDLELLDSHDLKHLQFLEKLPKRDLDKAVSQTRVKEKDAVKHKQPADNIQRWGGSSDDEDGAEVYERQPRRVATSKLAVPEKAAPLPIKSLEGEVITDLALSAGKAPVPRLQVEGVIVEDDLEQESVRRAAEAEKSKKAQREQQAERVRRKETPTEPAARLVLDDLSAYDSMEKRREEAKRAMAIASHSLLADPEGQVSKQLRVLLSLAKDTEDHHVARLAMLSCLAVFKDLIPGYRIRPPAELEAEQAGAGKRGVQAISKDVRQLWEYESALLRGYQLYLKIVLGALNASRAGHAGPTHGRVAARCLATLLSSAPHFNYASDVLQAVVPNMAAKDPQIRHYCCEAVSVLIAKAHGSADAGQTVLEAIQLVADLVKRRNCVAPPEVVTCLLDLSFPEIASGEDFEAAKASRKKKKKQKKGGDEVDRAFREAQAVVDRETRRHQQSATLEALFEIFFRVVKTATSSGLLNSSKPMQKLPVSVNPGEESTAYPDGSKDPISGSRFAKRFPLLAPTMEGFSKYAHLISVDYFQDLMATLETLLGSSALPPLFRMQCLLTTTTILRGQGEALTVDRRTFYTHLYASLIQCTLEPLEEDDEIDEKVESTTATASQQEKHGTTVAPAADTHDANFSMSVLGLMIRLLETMILDSKLLDTVRQASFAKRIAGMAASVADSGAAMGMLCVLHRMLRRQPKLRGMLENEAGGPIGYTSYRPHAEDPADAGGMAVPLWELTLLSAHFHPHVSQAALRIAGMNSISGSSERGQKEEGPSTDNGDKGGDAMLSMLPIELAMRYTTAGGGFRPAPKAPLTTSNGLSKKSSSRSAPGGGVSMDGASAFLSARRGSLGGIDGQEGYPLPSEYDAYLSARDGSLNSLNAEEALDTEDVEGRLKQHFTLNRRFMRNAELRHELNRLSVKLRLIHEHLRQGV